MREVREEGMVTRDYNCIRLYLAVPTVDQRTAFYFLIHWGLFQTNLGTIDNRARISDHNRCLALVITIPGYHHQQPHSVGGTIANSNFLFPPNVRVDFHTGQQQPFLHPSQVPPSVSQSHNLRLGSATGSASISNHSSNNHRSFSPGLGHFRRASLGTWSDRGADLRGSLGL